MPQLLTFFLYILHFFFFFVFFSKKANASDGTPLSPSTYCGITTTCGDKEIRYPFWKVEETTSTQYCGYPGFGIVCSPSDESIIHLPGDDFFVEEIDYANRRMKLVDIDVTKNQDCPRARHNLTLDQEFMPMSLNSSMDFNLTFYFNCTDVVPQPFTYSINCLSSGLKTSYVSLAGNEGVDLPWYSFCEDKVVATVMETQVAMNNAWVRSFGRALNEGFVLDWGRTMDCANCESSNGHCGYNNENSESMCFCTDGTIKFDHCKKGFGLNVGPKIGIAFGAAAVVTILLACFRICYCKYKVCLDGSILQFYEGKTRDDQNLEAMIKQYGCLSPRRYSYSDIKRITKSFKYKLGQGGYGDVYKGYLFDGRPVAVKILNTTKANGEEFINEVASISRTAHVNVVTLLGFCLDGRKRALIYEFLSNGSLEKYIHKESDNQLEMERLHEIAIAVARGLEYLHRGCNTRILHFDIKPHNILLDEDFCPKISDFGLAKLCGRTESIVSMLGARGTIGYIAPEVFSRYFGGVSYKSDVYSYGMMVLEMVGGRRNAVNVETSNSSEAYFPRWVYHRVMLDEDLKLKDRIMTKEEDGIARKMIIVGLWCIQTDPSHRPTISKVIEMLEGSLQDLELPPKPFLCSPSSSESVTIPIVLSSRADSCTLSS